MGVPVITFAGTAHRARVGASLLRAAGMERFIANDAEDFVRLAAEVAENLVRLVRSELESSALMDVKTFTRNLENAYRLMWTRTS